MSEQAWMVLSCLNQGEEWLHGYEMSRRTGLKPGTLYPLLERLSGRGLVESRWEDSPLPGRPRRRACRLTAAGHKQLGLGDTGVRGHAVGTLRPGWA